MIAHLLVAFLLLQSAFSFQVSDSDFDRQAQVAFDSFVHEYHRTYSPAEIELRRQAFFHNYRVILEHNSNPARTCTLGVNQFSDLTPEEYKARFPALTFPRPAIQPGGVEAVEPDLKLSVNWVRKGKFSPIKNQGGCGSCWGFAATSVVEATISIQRGTPPELYSEQMLVDCVKTPDTNGCAGGTPTDAYEYMQVNGTVYGKDYPYTARDQRCMKEKIPTVLRIKNHTLIPSGLNSQMERMIRVRPLSVGICVTSGVFMDYKSGIITKDCIVDEYNHIVSIVGAGTENGIPYWIVRNSWGSGWGENGYVRIARSADGAVGVCGIAYYPEYVNY